MAFDRNQNYPAPLKQWWQQILNLNNALSPTNLERGYDGLGYMYSPRLAYGKNMYMLSGFKSMLPYSNWRRDIYGNVIAGQPLGVGAVLKEGLERYENGQGSQEWINLPEPDVITLERKYSPIVYCEAKTIGELYTDIDNLRYSNVTKAIYSGKATRESDDNITPWWASIIGVDVVDDYSRPDLPPKFTNTHPLNDIISKYIITKCEVYTYDDSGSLVRVPNSNVISPVFLWDCERIMLRGDSNINELRPISIDGLIKTGTKPWDWRLDMYTQMTSIFNRANIYPTVFQVNVANDIYGGANLLTGLYVAESLTGMAGIRTHLDGVKAYVPPIFNTSLISIHNKQDGDSTSEYYNAASNGSLIYYINQNRSIMSLYDSRLAPKIVFDKPSDIRAMFEDLGCVFTFNLDEAKNFPAEDIPNGTNTPPAGYETNTVPTVDNYPDNSNDDFTSINTINPATVAADVHIFTRDTVAMLFDWFTTTSFWDSLTKLFNDPLSAIISLRHYPFDIPTHDPSGVITQSETTIVNVTNSEISGYKFIDGYNSVIDGGYIDYTAYYGNFADWALATYSVYIPYVGIVNVPSSAVVNKRLHLTYNVDFLSGNSVVILKTYDPTYNKTGFSNGQVVFMTTAKITTDIPIVYNNYNQQQLYNAMSALKIMQSVRSGTQSGAMNGVTSGNVGAAIAGGISGGLGSLFGGVTDYIANYPKTEFGAMGGIGDCGAFAPQNAYLIISRKVLAIPANGYDNISGNPSSYYGIINSANGFVKASEIKADGIPATITEINEIMSLLSTGIYV